MENLLLKPGTVLKLNGIPLTLKDNANFETSQGNHKLSLSHLEQLSLSPTQAASPVNLVTSSASLESM